MSACICQNVKKGWINAACPIHGVQSSSNDPMNVSERREHKEGQK